MVRIHVGQPIPSGSNFYVEALGGAYWWGFDNQAPAATNLLARLQGLVPAATPK